MNQTSELTTRTQQTRGSFGSTRDLVSLLFRRKAIFLTIFVTIFVASAFSLKNQKVVYVAGTKVLVIRGAAAVGQHGEAKPYLHWWEEMKTEVEVARSQPVLEMAVADLARQTAMRMQEEHSELVQAESEPVSTDILLAGLAVEPIDETDIILLTYRSLDRRDAIEGVNSITRAYIDRSREVRRDPHAAEIYRDSVDDAQSDADRLSAEVAAYKNQHRISDINSEIIELTRQRKAVEAHMIEVRASRRSTELEIETLDRLLHENPEVLLPSEDMKRDPQLGTYIRRLAEIDAQLNTLLATYTRDNPQVRAVERDRQSCIDDIVAQVSHYVSGKRTTVATLRGEERAYDDELARLDQRMSELPEHESVLGRLTQQLHLAQDQLEIVKEQQSSAGFRARMSPGFSKLRVINFATAATKLGGGARKQLFLVASILLALGLSFVAAFMVDTLDHSIKFPNDVEEALGVPVLASIREVRGHWSPAPGAPRGQGR